MLYQGALTNLEVPDSATFTTAASEMERSLGPVRMNLLACFWCRVCSCRYRFLGPATRVVRKREERREKGMPGNLFSGFRRRR